MLRSTPLSATNFQKTCTPISECGIDNKCDFGAIFKFDVVTVNIENDNRPFVNIKIKNKEFIALLDSGANVTVLGQGCEQIVSDLKLKKFPASGSVKTADDTKHSVDYFVCLPIEFEEKIEVVPALLIPTLGKELILGMDFWNCFGIQPLKVSMIETCESADDSVALAKNNAVSDPHDLTLDQKKVLNNVINHFPLSSPKVLGRTTLISHKIDTDDSGPIRQRYRPVSPYMQKLIDAELDRMLKLDVIESSTSAWANPLVIVTKSNGKIRLCLDSRKLNAVSKKMSYPLPNMGTILSQVNGAKFISSIDLSDAFWQIPLDNDAKRKNGIYRSGSGIIPI